MHNYGHPDDQNIIAMLGPAAMPWHYAEDAVMRAQFEGSSLDPARQNNPTKHLGTVVAASLFLAVAVGVGHSIITSGNTAQLTAREISNEAAAAYRPTMTAPHVQAEELNR